MKKTFPALLYILICLLILQACGGGSSTSNTSQETTTEKPDDSATEADADEEIGIDSDFSYEEPAPFEAKDLLYTWVDKLNIRENPNLKAKVITTVNSDEAVEVIGDKSDGQSTYVLRGVAYTDHWYKVKTKDGNKGWVFGGAVKRENEKKGNAPITAEKFNFAHFGSFDLSGWKKQGSKDESGGDAEINTGTYKKGNRLLEITKSETGEYGYSRTYRLMDGDEKLLKERRLEFIADFENSELIETVKDYTSRPPRQYQRKQKMKKHFIQLNAKPEMAYGPWAKGKVESPQTDPKSSSRYDPTKDPLFAGQKKMFELLPYGDLPEEMDDDGCVCTFRTHAKDYKTEIFFSNYESPPKEKAAIKLDGKVIVLKSAKFPNPDYKRGDYHAYYYNDQYELRIVATKEGQDDGGGSQYAGTMKLTQKDGTVLADINTFGSCGC